MRQCRGVLLEAVVTAVAAILFAVFANAVSPRGLSLTRNYFPAGAGGAASVAAPVRPAPSAASPSSPTATNTPEADEWSARLKDKGLQEIKRPALRKLLDGPGVAAGQVVLIDARDADHFEGGHLPGAYEFNPYHPEEKIGEVLAPCQAAEQVIVYCTGGECEDADTAAIFLRDAGVPAAKIFVYGGGYEEWNENHLPLETGARNSGVKINVK